MTTGARWMRRAALGTLAAWGALHVAGGGLLIGTAASEGGRSALELLGSGASAGEIPGEPGSVAEAVLGFHGFNLLVAGAAVIALAMIAARRGWPRGVSTAFGLIVAADAGLLLFLLAPGHMAVADGLWGPLLLALALPTAWAAGWRPRQL